MKRPSTLIPMIFLLAFARAGFCGQPDEKWADMSFGIDEADMQSIAVSSRNPDLIYAASSGGIYKSSDTGKNWRKLDLIRGTGASLTVIAVNPKNMDIIYAGTRKGLYKSADGGTGWKIVFEGLYDEEKNIRHILADHADSDRIFIGTDKGMLISRDAGVSWDRLVGEIAKQPVNFSAQDPADPGIIYAAAATGAFKSSNRGLSFKRVFTVEAQTDETATDEASGETGDGENQSYSDKTPNCIVIDRRDPKKVYIGANSGVFASSDSGETWEQLPGAGLLNSRVMALVSTNGGSLFAATKNGIFRFSEPEQRWHEIYNGILSRDARDLAYDRIKDAVWAATGKGLYLTYLKPAAGLKKEEGNAPGAPDDVAQFLVKFDNEPGIREVQEVAIKYADVQMEKVDKWRRDSKRKALLPTLSVSVSPYLTSLYHWETGSGTDSDVLRRGKQTPDWAVSASWDLGDLIWSTNETTIDGRARYLVQLRDDVLTGVTRLYFERRRLQVEFLTKPSRDINLKIAKQLRIEELTASIDVYTGGWFSKKLKKIRSRPE